MSLDEARTALDLAIGELDSSPERDMLSPLVVSAKEVLATTTPDAERTEAECEADLLACAAALPVLAAGLVFAQRRLQA